MVLGEEPTTYLQISTHMLYTKVIDIWTYLSG